jgi:SAM-dependent methyltransferase
MTEQAETKRAAISTASRMAVHRMITANRVTQLVYVAATLGLADLLSDGSLDADALVRQTGADPVAFRRFLRGLVTIGLLEHRPDGFALTPLGQWLRSDVPGSLRPIVLLMARQPLWNAWGRLADSVMTGAPSARPQSDGVFLDRHVEDPEYGAVFDEAMAAGSTASAPAILAAYDFSRFKRIVDVGGGQGALLAAILRATPGAIGVVFDLAPVIAGARERMEAQGIADRWELVAGDCFERVPAGGDAYLMKLVIHDWDDERSRTILRNCRRAIRPDGRLLLIEPVMPEEVDTSERARDIVLTDLHMLVATGGRERTEEEFRALYRDAGFRLTRVVPTTLPLSIVEGVPE